MANSKATLMMRAYAVTLLISWMHNSHSVQTDIDRSRYEDGRREYELISQRSEMPRYGTCWKNAVTTIQNGCKKLTDVVQGRLALAYLNCFLEFQSRPVYDCKSQQSLGECTDKMSDVDRGSYTTFFTHTQNICYFLQFQVWHEETEKTIDRLSDSSSQLATKLEDSYILQAQLLIQQEESINNQKTILDRAANLSRIISTSSEDFKHATHEQRLLITDVFDRVTKLQHMVLGEFSGMYSIVYYTLAIVVSYLLTSTSRTSSARFWLFSIMTVNMVVEQMIVAMRPGFLYYVPFYTFDNEEELIYGSHRLCRKISVAIGLVVIVICIYKYQDLNAINNQLLVEIRRQNSELRHCLMGNKPGGMITNGNHGNAERGGECEVNSTTVETDSAVSSYDSNDSASTIGDGNGNDSDRTFILHDDHNSSQSGSTHSFYSVLTGSSVTSELDKELRYLRQSTPIKQLPSSRIASWVKTGTYNSASSSRQTKGPSLEAPRYFLRSRKSTPDWSNPALDVESPNSFSSTVRHMEKIAQKNSTLARAMIKRGARIENSSDED